MGCHRKDPIADSKVDDIRADGFDGPRAFATQIVTINKALGLEDILEKLDYMQGHTKND